MRAILAGFLLGFFSLSAAEQGQLDASPSLFSVLAAINAAGYDAELDSPATDPLREQIRKELAARQVPVMPELKKFFEEHRQKDWTAELSQYISFALSTGGPPDFKYRFPSNQLPPDVFRLQGFDALMKRFHGEANIEELWRKSQPAFERVIERYHGPVSRAILEVNAYLRNVTSGYLGRQFQIYVDLLGAPNQIHTRSYADDYFIVVTPSPEPQTNDVRHAYLHYLLDPVALKASEHLEKKRALIDYAQGAPFLEPMYKEDFQLLATECLVKAVETRLAPAARRQALVDQALGEGYVLTPVFAEQLPVYEKQEQSMRFYFAEMAKAIDLGKEARRLDKVQFAQERPVRKAKVVPAPPKPEPTAAEKTLAEAERLYADRQLGPAKEAYLKALRETDVKPRHAQAYYGLARIAALERDPELAERLFRKTLELSPDAPVKAWSLIYLARLAEASGEREQALDHYRAALAVEGSSPAARQAAEKALGEASRKGNRPEPN